MNQKQIVKERLNYHFKNADGSWNVPNGMPFMNEFLNEVEKLASDGVSADVSEIQNRAKKELLNAYYVAIYERNMSVEDIMQSIEADRQFLDGEMVLGEAKSILNGR